MLRYTLTPILLLSLPALLKAQTDFSIRWEPNPRIHSIPDSFSHGSAVYILQEKQMEYRVDKKDITVYRTIHQIVKPLDERGLESFNKFTIPVGEDRELVSIKARTILPGGRVIELSHDKIRRIRNEEGLEEYLAALEGVSKGAEVELIYTEKRPVSLFGTERFQLNLPVMKSEFRLITPTRFRFQTKGYNGVAPARDSLSGKYRHYSVVLKNIPALEDEPYSNRELYLKKLAWKLSYVEGENGLESPRQFTWDELTRTLYQSCFAINEKEKKAVERYLAENHIGRNLGETEKIRRIEEVVKTGIAISGTLNEETYANLETVIRTKSATDRGITRLMIACLLQSGVRCELGLTSNRLTDPVDEHFEIWNILDQYVLYFPGPGNYLSPNRINYRYPFIPYTARGNKGIFCSPDVRYNLYASFIASIRNIPELPMESSRNDISAAIRFKGESLSPEVNITHSFSGYEATALRDRLVFSSRDKEKEIVADIIGLADRKEDLLSYKVEHTAFSAYNDNKPLSVNAVVLAPSLLEKAGNRYLFKVGEVIGNQTNMYQQDKRQLPVDMHYRHQLERKIRIEIPQGYQLKNPEAVRMNIVHQDKSGKEVMGFVSDYSMEGSSMLITIREFYAVSQLPLSDYESFRKVINAAADFNKVVLVLLKK